MNKAKRRRALFRVALRRRRFLPYNVRMRMRSYTSTPAKAANAVRCFRYY